MSIPDIDAATVNHSDGCVKCRRSWPTASFVRFNEAIARGESPEYVCDLCLEFSVDDVGQAIEEAQGSASEIQAVIREVIVSGIASRKNILGWRYVTHRNGPLAFTDLEVDFQGPKSYRYSNVPVAACEALLVASSIGAFFSEQIEHSYRYERIT